MAVFFSFLKISWYIILIILIFDNTLHRNVGICVFVSFSKFLLYLYIHKFIHNAYSVQPLYYLSQTLHIFKGRIDTYIIQIKKIVSYERLM